MIDEKGQIAVDFLLGISLFLIALTFTVQFIPGMFISGSAEESSLDYTAYRTATVLVEDTGWWGNSTSSGTNWEDHPNNIMRIGLAVDDDTSSKLTNSPNLISKNKTEQLMLVNESVLIEKLGIYNNVDGTLFSYGYNISITQNDEPLLLNNTTAVWGESAPDNKDIAKITRVVLIEKGKIASFEGYDLTSQTASKATINITGPFEDNITIQISDLNCSYTDSAFLNATLDGTLLNRTSNYTVHKMDGWTASKYSGNLSNSDILRLNFDHDLFNASTEHRLDLRFRNVTLPTPGPPFARFNDHSSTHYEPTYMTVEVWQ